MTSADASPVTLRRLLLQLVWLLYVPAVVAVAAALALGTLDNLDRVRADLQDRADLLAEALQLRLVGTREQVERLAAELPPGAEGWAAFHERATRAAPAMGADTIVVLDPRGRQLLNTLRPYGTPLPDPPDGMQRAVRVGKATVNNAAPGPVTGRLVVGVAVPVIRQGRIAYGVTAAMQVSRLQDLLAGIPPGWYGAILDGNRTIVARVPHPEQAVGRPATADVLEAVGKARSGVQAFGTLEGVPVLAAFRTDDLSGWTVVVSVPRATLQAPVWRQSLGLAFAATVLLVLLLAVTRRFQRAIVDSVQALADVPLQAMAGEKPLAFAEAQSLRERLREDAVQLRAAHAEVDRMNRDFQRRLMARSDERLAALGEELHDHVGASLAGLAMVLARLRRDATPATASMLERAVAIAEDAGEAIRRISRGILPVGVERGGLPGALERLAADLQELHGIACTVEVEGSFDALPPSIAQHLYRITQEAATNAFRHGAARQVWVSLRGDGGEAELRVDDDGQGPPASAVLEQGAGIGLRTMRTRAASIGGTVRFERSLHGGMAVVVRWPADGG